MKISPFRITVYHTCALRDAQTGKFTFVDLLTIYLLPILIASLSFFLSFSVTTEVYNVSVTFFGIFIALLLNMQVAVFGIYLRRWEPPTDKILLTQRYAKLLERKLLLREVNASISYLVLISCFALVWFLFLLMKAYTCGVWPAISVLLYAHFMLTLLMVVKRVHVLFAREYT